MYLHLYLSTFKSICIVVKYFSLKTISTCTYADVNLQSTCAFKLLKYF